MATGDPVQEFLDCVRCKIEDLCGTSTECHAKNLLLDGWSASTIATQMLCGIDRVVEEVFNANRPWIEVKRNRKIKRDKDLANVCACLAEIRAYDDLLQVFPTSTIKAMPDRNGPEFILSMPSGEVWIEVCTPDLDRTDLVIVFEWILVAIHDCMH